MSNLFLMPDESSRRKFIVPKGFADIIPANSQTSIALLNSHESEIILGADDAENFQIASAYMSLREITASCDKIQASSFSLIEPEPKWYKGLKGKYDTVQSVVKKWNTELSVNVTNSIPNSVLAFNPICVNVSDDIIKITNKYPDYTDIASVEDRKNIANALTFLIDKTEGIILNTSKCNKDLNAWVNNFSDASNALNKEADIIITEQGYIKADIDAANDTIKTCKDNIEKYKSYVTTGQVLVGIGSGIAIAGLGLLVIPEPTLITKIVGGVLIGVGVLLGAGGAVSWGVYETRVKDARENIAIQEDNIRKLDNTLGALSALKMSMDVIDTNAKTALTNTKDFLLSWDLFNGELINLRNRNSDSTVTINSSEIRYNMKAGQTHWQNSFEYSKNLLGLSIKPIVDPVADIAI